MPRICAPLSSVCRGFRRNRSFIDYSIVIFKTVFFCRFKIPRCRKLEHASDMQNDATDKYNIDREIYFQDGKSNIDSNE